MTEGGQTEAESKTGRSEERARNGVERRHGVAAAEKGRVFLRVFGDCTVPMMPILAQCLVPNPATGLPSVPCGSCLARFPFVRCWVSTTPYTPTADNLKLEQDSRTEYAIRRP